MISKFHLISFVDLSYILFQRRFLSHFLQVVLIYLFHTHSLVAC